MKFRLVENKLPEQIVEDVQEEYKEQQETLDQVREILTKEQFEEEKKLNGIAFTKVIEEEGYSIKAQMYVDTTTFDYSTYISSEDEKGDTNFSSKGKYDGLITAAKRLVFEIGGI